MPSERRAQVAGKMGEEHIDRRMTINSLPHIVKSVLGNFRLISVRLIGLSLTRAISESKINTPVILNTLIF